MTIVEVVIVDVPVEAVIAQSVIRILRAKTTVEIMIITLPFEMVVKPNAIRIFNGIKTIEEISAIADAPVVGVTKPSTIRI